MRQYRALDRLGYRVIEFMDRSCVRDNKMKKTHAIFFIIAFMATLWYAALNFTSMSNSWVLTLLLLAMPWVGLIGAWCWAEARYEEGYHVGESWGRYEARHGEDNGEDC